MKTQSEKLLNGLAGEYLVAGVMNLHGWVASLTLKNYPGVDIFGMDPKKDKDKVVNIQVKTTVDNSFWVGLKHSEIKNGEIFNKIQGPYVFVHIPKEDPKDYTKVEFYILSRSQVIDLVTKSDIAYQVKERSKPLAEDYAVALHRKKDNLAAYKDCWQSLWIE